MPNEAIQECVACSCGYLQAGQRLSGLRGLPGLRCMVSTALILGSSIIGLTSEKQSSPAGNGLYSSGEVRTIGERRMKTICSICSKPVETHPNGWTKGHNAYPVNGGRCCDRCEWEVVIPARLSRIKLRRAKNEA